MTNEVFPNAKPILLGENQQIPGPLSGSVVSDLTDLSNFDYPNNTGSFTPTITETVFVTTTINITKAVNKILIDIRIQGTSGFGSNFTLLKLRRGGLTGTILSSGQVNGTGIKIFNVTDTNPPIGNTDYVVTAQRTVPSHTVGLYPGGLPGVVVLGESDDTHASTITGSDTHTTHEDGVLQ